MKKTLLTIILFTTNFCALSDDTTSSATDNTAVLGAQPNTANTQNSTSSTENNTNTTTPANTQNSTSSTENNTNTTTPANTQNSASSTENNTNTTTPANTQNSASSTENNTNITTPANIQNSASSTENNTNITTPANTQNSASSTENNTNTTTPANTQNSTSSTENNTNTTTPADNQNSSNTTTAVNNQSTTANASPIDCNVKIPATTSTIETNFLLEWAKNAITQSFHFTPNNIDDELNALKACYTDQGWQGFQDALKKSGNLIAIKTQQFDVSSNVLNTPDIQTIHNNQWKVSLDMDVVYQNSKEKLTQNLNITILIGRKITGDLGIMQVIAIPKSKNS